MRKVNIHCHSTSVKHKTTIAVLMDFVFDPDRLRSELATRLEEVAREESVNPVSLKAIEVARDGDHAMRLFITYPPSLPNIEEIILGVLGGIEAGVRAIIEADQMRSLVIQERVVVQ